MIPAGCKRLAEVDFPIADVSRHAAREKSIRHGHPSTLHVWWARRPLASSRAVLLGLLWPDPCDAQCPDEFKAEARKRLREVGGCDPGTTDEELRRALLRFIADFANWDNARSRTHLDVSDALVKAAHAAADGMPYEPPLVVDPFAGGGSIPLEAVRLGCETFASDLNPVACLILKATLEAIPRCGQQLADNLRRVGTEIRDEVEGELGDLYPRDPDGAIPIAYLWARTVRCEAPRCGAQIPLVRNRWLFKKRSMKRALRFAVDEKSRTVRLDVFEPKADADVEPGTIRRSRARCVVCGSTLSQERIQAQLQQQAGGGDVQFDGAARRVGGATLLGVVTKRGASRDVRAATAGDYERVAAAGQRLEEAQARWKDAEISFTPNERLSRVPVSFGVINVWVYGVQTWGDLFAARQKLVLCSLMSRVRALERSSIEEAATALLAAIAVSRFADDYSNMMRWMDRGTPAATFARPALPMVWDFCEVCPFDDASWSLAGSFDWVAKAVENIPLQTSAHVERVKAQSSPLPDAVAAVWFTDPPYYDNIPYSYLSDFFYVWLRRMLARYEWPATSPALTEKADEIVAYIGPDGDSTLARRRFEDALGTAFREGKRVLSDDGVGSIVFAHQTTEGWEALLSAMSQSGWVITASWPIATERKGRPRAHDSAALATSVHLICRPRRDDAGIGDWADVLRELPTRVGDWMERLQGEGVRGADLVFACIGPALEIFSRYEGVETADGRKVELGEYLEKVWEVVGRTALGQVLGTAEARARNGAAGAVEEDARLTALFLWTLQATDGEAPDTAVQENENGEDVEDVDDGDESGRKAKGLTLVFDVVRRFAQPLGIDLPKWDGRVIEISKGVVRLLPVAERAKQLFGGDGAQAVASRIEQDAALGLRTQLSLFPEERQPALRARGRGARRGRKVSDGSMQSSGSGAEISEDSLTAPREATTLDRVHAAMLLQAGGRTNALRALVKAEQERSPDFLRLANALSALYPRGSEEKRLLDAMLLAVPR